MSDNPLSGKVSLDTTDYKAGVAALNREIRVIETGFRATAAAMGEWDKTSAGLEARQKALTSQMELQKQKVSALKGEYEKVAAEKGATSKAAQDLEIRINRETESLNKMEGELKQTDRALEEMGDESKDAAGKVDELGRKQDEAGRKSGGFKTALSGLGGVLKATAALAVSAALAIGGIAAGLASTIGPASDLSETMSKVGVVFGDQADGVLAFGDTAAQALGMSKNAALAAAGTYGNLFRAMGMAEKTSAEMSTSLVTLAGDLASFNNMDPTEVLDKLRSGLSGETEPLKALGVNINQALVQQKAFEMGLSDGSAALDASTKAQATYALIMEQTKLAQGDFARTSEGLANQQRILAATFEDIKAKIGTGLLPTLQQLAGTASNYLGRFSDLIGDPALTLQEKVSKAGEIVGSLADEITKGLPGMAEAAFGIIEAIITGIVETIPQLVPVATKILIDLVGFIVEMLPLLLEAGLQMIISLALGIAQALPELIPTVVEIIPKLILILLENLPLLIDAALQLILALAEGLIAALPVLIPQIPVIVRAIFDALILALPLIGKAALELILMLVKGLGENLPMVGKAAGELVMELVRGATDLLYKMVEVGADLVAGVWKGLAAKRDWFYGQVKGFFTGIVDGVKNTLGIHSPSTVFAGIGENMALGLGGGFNKAFQDIEQGINGAMEGLGGGLNGNFSFSGAGAAGGGNRYEINLGGIHIAGNGDADVVQGAAEKGILQGLRAVGLA